MDSLANKNIKITASTVKDIKSGILFKQNQIRGYHTKINKSLTHFTPLKINKNVNLKPFTTMDIETMEHLGNQVPIAISITNNLESKFFIINDINNIELSIKNL